MANLHNKSNDSDSIHINIDKVMTILDMSLNMNLNLYDDCETQENVKEIIKERKSKYIKLQQ